MNNHENIYAALSNEELLKKLVGAQQLRKHYRGTLRPLFSQSSSNESVPEKCAVARELFRRWLKEELNRGCVLSTPTAVREYLRLNFAGQEHESFLVLFLDSQNRMTLSDELFRGTLTQTSVYPREIVKAALRHNAAAVIFAHNHPSGNAEPSSADQALTRALQQALALVDVKVLDHFIVGASSEMSFAERGLL